MHKRTKINITIFVLLVGMASMFTAVVTDYWAVIKPAVEQYNTTCEAAHFGLWRLCKKQIYMSEDTGHGCGPLSLPGVENCTYFRHFTPGEESEVLDYKTQKEYNISAAAISIFSLGFMFLGILSVICSCTGKGKGKRRDYLLKPAGMFYAFAGICSFCTLEVMRQSVKRMIESTETVWVEYDYGWSFACACAGFVLQFLAGLTLFFLAMPQMPRNAWETCMDAEPEQQE